MLMTLACGTVIKVDPQDAGVVRSRKWRLRKGDGSQKDYVCQGSVYLHRVIMRAGPDDLVDHKSGDTLDMRRVNLRLTTAQGNARNQAKKRSSPYGICTSRFKGVSLDRRATRKPWRAQIRLPDGRMKYLGQFQEEREAAYAYDLASVQFHGDQGRRNFLPMVVDHVASML